MPPPDARRVLIVGCGASLRRDDQIGLRVAEALGGAPLPDWVQVKTTECPGADLLQELEGRRDIELLVVLDAAAPGPDRPPGSWRRIDYRREPHRIRRGDLSNVHGFGAEAAFEMAAQMDLLPTEVWVYVVAAGDVGYGEELTPAVSEAIGGLATQVCADVAAWLHGREDRDA